MIFISTVVGKNTTSNNPSSYTPHTNLEATHHQVESWLDTLTETGHVLNKNETPDTIVYFASIDGELSEVITIIK